MLNEKNMKLKHFWHAGGVLHFDPVTGEVRPTESNDNNDIEWGFLWKQRGKWFAIWRDDKHLVFQHKSQQWRLASDHEFRVRRGFRRKFEIIERISSRNKQVFSFSYWFKGAAFVFIDPTYDAIDEESDDFFLYIVTMWQSWKDIDLPESFGGVGHVQPAARPAEKPAGQP
jgi:hypothetical protein